MRNLAAHRDRTIRLVVQRARDPRDHRTRPELADEDDTAAYFAVGKLASYIKAEIHLVEVPVKRDGHADHARVEEPEPDDARHRASLAEVEAPPPGDAGRECVGCDLVVQHDEPAPLGCEERRARCAAIDGW